MPRHKIPGDRLVKNAAGTAQTERDVIELPSPDFTITTPDANTHDVDVAAGGSLALTPADGIDPYHGRSIWYVGALNVADVGVGFFDISGMTPDLEGSPTFIDAVNSDFANGTIVFSESGLYSTSWYMEQSVDPGVYFTKMQLVSLHQFHVSLSANNEFSFQKMRGGASPYWSAHSNITDWYVGSIEDPVDWSQILLKYNRDGADPAIPYTITNCQITITKIA